MSVETVQTAKTENEKKKAYLWQYQDSVRRVARIESELSEIRAMKAGSAINYNGMPSGSGQGDLSDYVAELDRLERELISERYERIRLYQDIAWRIKRLKSQNENDVLFYHYIKGLNFWEIAEKMNYSERWIHKIHGRGLAHLETPKEFIEVQ